MIYTWISYFFNQDVSLNESVEFVTCEKPEFEKININIRDLIPPKYERYNQSDLAIKYLTLGVIGIDVLIFFGTIKTSKWEFNRGKNILTVFSFIFMVLFFILDIAWLHYKIQHMVFGGYKLFMDLNLFKTNSKYYSGLEIPDCFTAKPFPNITIQLPVYKEDLENTIAPTIRSALVQSRRYTFETGKTCNIIVCDDGLSLLSEEDRVKRILFYKENDIGYSARPLPSRLPRIGRFKKAGNLNFSMNFSPCFMDPSITDPLFQEYQKVLALGACFGGNIKYGSYIFLIDSDTRISNFPPDKNGCFKRLVKEFMFDGEKILYMQCFTAPYLSTKSISEKCVFHFTCHIYNGILVGTAMCSMSPLVGHNAFLNTAILTEIAQVHPETNFRYYWGEDRISEDFDCMMRGCERGYIGRYISYAGIFMEGVSFSYMTEYFKVSKFACGAAELTFNPVSEWREKGFFSPDIIGFIFCKEIEWYNKIGILAYILNFIAIAQSHFAMFFNLLFFEQLFNILPYGLLPVNLMWEGMIVWGAFNTVINLLFAKRVKFDYWVVLRQQIRELFFTSSLYGSLSVRFSIMYASHFFNLPVQFGATQKDEEQVLLVDWIRSTKIECTTYMFYFCCIFVRILFFPVKSPIHTFYFGCLPLFMNIFWYWTGPLAYDILPRQQNKKETDSFIASEKMFRDKYDTIIPNSPVFIKN